MYLRMVWSIEHLRMLIYRYYEIEHWSVDPWSETVSQSVTDLASNQPTNIKFLLRKTFEMIDFYKALVCRSLKEFLRVQMIRKYAILTRRPPMKGPLVQIEC